MLGQLNLWGKNKVEVAIERIQAFEPKEGYYLAFSGGKDSQCIYHLAKEAGVKFSAHYRVTSVDPPELVQFIKKQYPDVHLDVPRYSDGSPATMWNLIPKKQMPPTRLVRYCCQILKETGGQGLVTMTGVRWAESPNRAENQGLVTMPKKSKKLKQTLEENGVNFQKTMRGGVVLNTDNSESRRAIEFCYRTWKTLVNPIIDWDDSEVWEYLNEWVKVPHCSLYDEGFTRIGCIGCPMGGKKQMLKEFERWPKYKEAYLRACERSCEHMTESKQKVLETYPGKTNGEKIFNWWMREPMKGKDDEEDTDTV